jgi:DNA-binding response OmpR family regulator
VNAAATILVADDDVRLPQMNGLEAIRRLKGAQALEHIPAVIVTGLDDTRARLEALALGADDFLLKPVHMAELLARRRSRLRGLTCLYTGGYPVVGDSEALIIPTAAGFDFHARYRQ